jgi:two-component system, OmpR family, sensor kinase
MFLKSLRWRLQVWHGLLLVGVLAGFGVTAYQLQRTERLRHVDQDLDERLGALLRQVREGEPVLDLRPPPNGRPPVRPEEGGFPPPPEAFRPPDRARSLFGSDSAGEAFYYIIWRRDGSELSRSTNAPADLRFPDTAATGQSKVHRQRGVWREALTMTPPGERFLVGRSIATDLAELRAFAGWLFVAGGAVLALGLAGGWWLAGRAIRPIRTISATAGRIAEGRLAERIDAAAMDDELGGLAAVLNDTFARLDDAFARQKQFTADASHELRTPVSVILTQTQLALGRERPAAEYRDTLEACQRAAQRMRRLIESLLELARLDAGQEPLKREAFRLDATVNDCLGLLRPLAEKQRLTLHTELASVELKGDAERIAQVVTNLLTNAIHYNREDGELRVAVRAENGGALLTVSDTGLGITPEHLPHIFDRFNRADQARTTSHGRTGLGLAISKAIVEAHGGAIEVASEPGVGTTFTVRLPAA